MPSRYERQQRLVREVHSVLQAGVVHRLADLGATAEHGWGWVVGGCHEFVAIDRNTFTLTLIVASDD